MDFTTAFIADFTVHFIMDSTADFIMDFIADFTVDFIEDSTADFIVGFTADFIMDFTEICQISLQSTGFLICHRMRFRFIVKFCHVFRMKQWRIQGVPPVRAPLRVQILSF